MGIVGADFTHREHHKISSRQGKKFTVRGYKKQNIHILSDDTSDDEMPSKVKYATIVQEEPFVSDDDELFSK